MGAAIVSIEFIEKEQKCETNASFILSHQFMTQYLILNVSLGIKSQSRPCKPKRTNKNRQKLMRPLDVDVLTKFVDNRM